MCVTVAGRTVEMGRSEFVPTIIVFQNDIGPHNLNSERKLDVLVSLLQLLDIQCHRTDTVVRYVVCLLGDVVKQLVWLRHRLYTVALDLPNIYK